MIIFKNNKISSIMYIVLWWIVICCFSFFWINTYQVPKDIFFNIACLGIMAIMMIANPIGKVCKEALIFTAIYFLGKVGYIIANWNGMGYQYKLLLISKYSIVILFVCVLFDWLKNRYSVTLCFDARIYTFFACLVIGVALFVSYEGIINIVLPIFAIMMIYPSKEQMKEQYRYIAIASYINFTCLMTYSLLFCGDMPAESRWTGVFVFPVAGGVVASLAVLALIYKLFMIRDVSEKRVRNIRIVVTVALMIYPFLSLILLENKTTVIALVFCMLLAWAFGGKNCTNNADICKRVILSFAGFIIAISAVVSVFCVMSKLKRNIAYMSDGVVRSALMYISRKGEAILSGTDYYGVFTGKHILLSIDAALSSRLTLWYLGIKQIKLWGNPDPTIYSLSGEFIEAHAHNTYINWMIAYGAIVGLGLTIAFIGLFVLQCKAIAKGKREYIPGFLWTAFSVVFCVFEKEMWTSPVIFFSVVFALPLLVVKENEKIDGNIYEQAEE